jgi:dihydroorotate dehydrogenase
LRGLQNREAIGDISRRVRSALQATGSGAALLLKISPDLASAELAGIAEVAMAGAFDGIIVGNTTTSRPAGLDPALAGEAGGLSGRPLLELSTRVLREMYHLTRGRVPLVGVGGIADGRDAYAKIRAGASLVQLYTGLVYRGPGLVEEIKRELLLQMERDGCASLAEAVGKDHRVP